MEMRSPCQRRFQRRPQNAASAHSAQRTSLLIAHLLQTAAANEEWGIRRNTGRESLMTKLVQWADARRIAMPQDNRQAREVAISVYQDDITVIAIGWDAANTAELQVKRILVEDYGVQLSEKTEGNVPFGHRFSSIGATYDLIDACNMVCRPTDHTTTKYKQSAEQLRPHIGMLRPFNEIESFVGLHTFITRFLDQGAVLNNEAYVCLRASGRIQTQHPMAPYNKQFAETVAQVLHMLENKKYPSITEPPIYWHSGMEGGNSDASASATASNKGWGVCVMGNMTGGAWDAQVRAALAKGLISISPLELLGSAIALEFAHQHKWLPNGTVTDGVILRNDNNSACIVINTWRANSIPMLAALRIMRRVVQRCQVRVRIQHIAGERNHIADDIRRGRRELAMARALQLWGQAEWREPPTSVSRWVQEIVRTASNSIRGVQAV